MAQSEKQCLAWLSRCLSGQFVKAISEYVAPCMAEYEWIIWKIQNLKRRKTSMGLNNNEKIIGN